MKQPWRKVHISESEFRYKVAGDGVVIKLPGENRYVSRYILNGEAEPTFPDYDDYGPSITPGAVKSYIKQELGI